MYMYIERKYKNSIQCTCLQAYVFHVEGDGERGREGGREGGGWREGGGREEGGRREGGGRDGDNLRLKLIDL